MRPVLRLLPVLGAALAFACGSSDGLMAPPPTELSFTIMLNPDATGGMRPSTTVSAVLLENDEVTGVLESAEFTVFDLQGAVLARQTVAGPVTFGANRAMTIQRVLDWAPAEVLGRSLTARFTLDRPNGPLVIQRTIAF